MFLTEDVCGIVFQLRFTWKSRAVHAGFALAALPRRASRGYASEVSKLCSRHCAAVHGFKCNFLATREDIPLKSYCGCVTARAQSPLIICSCFCGAGTLYAPCGLQPGASQSHFGAKNLRTTDQRTLFISWERVRTMPSRIIRLVRLALWASVTNQNLPKGRGP